MTRNSFPRAVLIVALLAMTVHAAAAAQPVAAEPPACADYNPVPRNKALHDELVAMETQDQAIRNEWVDKGMKNDPDLIGRWTRIDTRDLARMRQIIAQFGWPEYKLAGHDGGDAAWVLVQHGDTDPSFQAYCLPKMKAAVDRGEADKGNYALLTDRVLLAEGKKQLYGTQFMWGKDKHDPEPRPLQDPAHVDQRRAAMGLQPLAEYRQLLIQYYKLPTKP